jgi:hypothetical protein
MLVCASLAANSGGALFTGTGETAWNWRRKRDYWAIMGHSQGRTNAKKRAARRKKTERLALAKKKKAAK